MCCVRWDDKMWQDEQTCFSIIGEGCGDGGVVTVCTDIVFSFVFYCVRWGMLNEKKKKNDEERERWWKRWQSKKKL